MSRPSASTKDPTIDSRCGTRTGYKEHRKRGEKSCGPCDEANKTYHRAYYRANRERIIQQNTEYATTNHEARQLRMKMYMAQMYVERRDAILARNAKYRAENIEKVKVRQERYRVENPDVFAAAARRRRARRYGVAFERFTVQDVLDRWGTDCHICGERIDFVAPRTAREQGWERGLQLEHVIPLFQGGTDTLDNVKPAHGLCNAKKSWKERYGVTV